MTLLMTGRDAQESGDYAEAIMRCAECFDHLETLGNLVVRRKSQQTICRPSCYSYAKNA